MRQTIGRADPDLARAYVTLTTHSRLQGVVICMTSHAVDGFRPQIIYLFHHLGEFVCEVLSAIYSPGRRHGPFGPFAILKPVVLIADADRFDIPARPTSPLHVRSIRGREFNYARAFGHGCLAVGRS